MEIYGREPATSRSSRAPRRPSTPQRRESHRWLRRLASRDRLVRAVFGAHPQWTEIDVVVFQPRMDAVTGMIDTGRLAYRHRRDG